MSQLSLFPTEDEPPPTAARLAPRLKAMAARGVLFGTSSWKYPGWLGSIYSPRRYAVRGRFSQSKFEAECLAEYARTFPLAGGDFTFYQFPSDATWRRLFEPVPPTLQFAFKVPEEITVAVWPDHPRYGERAGRPNPSFLDPELFTRQFVKPLEPWADRAGVLMFEFGAFGRSTFPTVEAFVAELDPFLARLPQGPRYAVEIRNPEFLVPSYLDTLTTYNVAHVFNAWTRMPEIGEQMELEGAFTADFVVARALLKRGRAYEQAVASFEPYERVQEPNERARDALAGLAKRGTDRKKPTFLLVNNRLEGHAPGTIEGVLDRLGPALPGMDRQ